MEAAAAGPEPQGDEADEDDEDTSAAFQAGDTGLEAIWGAVQVRVTTAKDVRL